MLLIMAIVLNVAQLKYMPNASETTIHLIFKLYVNC